MSRPRNAANVFRAIADPKRRRIVELLNAEDRTVGELIEIMRLGGTAMSYHLGVLMASGLVRQRRRGTFMMCVAQPAGLAEAHAWLGRNLRTRKPHVAPR